MEFCPGGDLHTLRQRQAGKHFSEQAAKYALLPAIYEFIVHDLFITWPFVLGGLLCVLPTA
jgi:hypothetical protein